MNIDWTAVMLRIIPLTVLAAILLYLGYRVFERHYFSFWEYLASVARLPCILLLPFRWTRRKLSSLRRILAVISNAAAVVLHLVLGEMRYREENRELKRELEKKIKRTFFPSWDNDRLEEKLNDAKKQNSKLAEENSQTQAEVQRLQGEIKALKKEPEKIVEEHRRKEDEWKTKEKQLLGDLSKAREEAKKADEEKGSIDYRWQVKTVHLRGDIENANRDIESLERTLEHTEWLLEDANKKHQEEKTRLEAEHKAKLEEEKKRLEAKAEERLQHAIKEKEADAAKWRDTAARRENEAYRLRTVLRDLGDVFSLLEEPLVVFQRKETYATVTQDRVRLPLLERMLVDLYFYITRLGFPYPPDEYGRLLYNVLKSKTLNIDMLKKYASRRSVKEEISLILSRMKRKHPGLNIPDIRGEDHEVAAMVDEMVGGASP